MTLNQFSCCAFFRPGCPLVALTHLAIGLQILRVIYTTKNQRNLCPPEVNLDSRALCSFDQILHTFLIELNLCTNILHIHECCCFSRSANLSSNREHGVVVGVCFFTLPRIIYLDVKFGTRETRNKHKMLDVHVQKNQNVERLLHGFQLKTRRIEVREQKYP